MKKRGFAVLALAALMTLGSAGMVSMAAEGWAQEGNNWVYYNASGSRVYDGWRQDGNGYWRYLDGSGVMAVDTWVDNDNYYVDSNGIMVAGRWLEVINDDAVNGRDWYYFTSSGKAVKEKWEKINNKWYHFDDNGVMETGWILEDMYYCDSNGAMVTGWQRLLPPDEYDDDYYENHYGPYETEDDGKYWYYFSNSGKKVVPKDSETEIATKKINGVYYALAEDGSMRTGWVSVTGDESDDITDYRYVDSNGQVRVGWYSIEPPENLANNYEHDVEWFYFDKKGVPTVGPMRGAATTKDLKRINGNTYLFNENGTPVYGLQKVYTDSNESEYTAYYFGTRKQSSMLKGKHQVDEGGDTVQYYFSSTGRGYTGVYDNYLYYMGKVQKADSGSKYEVFTIYTSKNNARNYVVNTSGRIAKNTTVKDREGTKYKTNSGGVLVKEDGEDVDGNTYSSPAEPEWEYDR